MAFTPLPLLLLFLLPLSLRALPLPSPQPSPTSNARLFLRAPPPPLFTSWYSTGTTWYSADTFTSPSVTLAGVTRVCPADYPLGFTVVCDPGNIIVKHAIFSVGGHKIKYATRSWYGPYEVEGHFRGGAVVWEGFAFGDTVTCRLGKKLRVTATIKVDC